ncbi:MAG: deoxyribonuclease IV, partial [Fibrobacter sp.]|nr:deoxyribonuclease IV [Fibrobacter sp.]
KFEHIAQIIELTEDKSRIGFCIDTCHTYAAGYDLRTKETYENTMKQIENTIGFSFLRGVHLNDSKVKHGSRLDRHESIGKGKLGLPFFKMIMNDKRFDDIPMILETIDETLWPAEITMLYNLIDN